MHELTIDDPGGSIDHKAVHALHARRDGPALVRITAQLGLLAGAFAATMHLASLGNPAWLATVTAAGLVLATLFAAEHETGHGTAFASRWLNEITLTVCAFAMLQAPSFFKEFHWQHHRHTQDRAHDPEIAAAPELVADWPSSPLRYVLLVSGLPLLFGKMAFTAACAVLPNDALWERVFPFVRPAKRTRVAAESRLVIFAWGLLVLFGFALVPHFALLLLAWPVAHLVLGLYLMAEHTGLPEVGTQLQRTRTTVSNRFVRYWMWNMTYHAEHHAHPAVPFHALGTLHERLGESVEHQSSGYLALHRQALRHAFGRA